MEKRMVKADYDSKLHRQVMSYPGLARAQVEGFYKGMAEASFPPEEVLRELRHIYLTGSGDCWAAAMICKPVFEKLLGSFSAKVYADSPLHIGRFRSLTASADDPEVAARTLLVGLSVWGFPARIVECFRRAQKLGVHTLDITNNVQSPVAEAAEYILNVHNPEFPDLHPGCRDYFGTLVSAALTAAKISEVKGLRPKGIMEQLAGEIISMADSWAGLLEDLDQEMFQLACQLSAKVDRCEGVGDGVEYASAFFFPAKVIETSGRFATWTDTIHFRKNSIRYREPGRILTIFYGREDSANRESLAAAVDLAVRVGREVLLVADAPWETLGISSPVRQVLLPKAPKEWPELAPFFDHLPGDLLASYLCDLWGGCYFRGGSSGSFTADQITTIWGRPDMSTLKGSKIVIVEEER